MTKFCFLTRDLHNDYPRIGWLPQLPAGAERLWRQFSANGWEEAEYPEIVLQQKGGQWQLFMSAMDSGRRDSADGRGRVIRMTMYLSGTTAEGDSSAGLVAHFLKEIVGKDGTALKELLLSRIGNSDPTAWRDEGPAKQEAVAEELLKELQSLPPCLVTTDSPASWAGGCDVSLSAFYGVCRDLLTGKRDGMAISLTNLLECEVSKAMATCRKIGDTVILLTGIGETSLPLKEFRQSSHTSANPRKPASRNGDAAGQGNKRWLGGLALAAVGILAVVLSLRSCGKKLENEMDMQSQRAIDAKVEK